MVSAGADLDDSDAALELVVVRGDRCTAEDGGLPDPRQAHEGQSRVEGESSRIARHALRRWCGSPVAMSTCSSLPMPELRTYRLSLCQRGECGMSRPVVTVSPEATSRTSPLSFRDLRQPPGSSLAAMAVTNAGAPRSHGQAVQVAPVLRGQLRDERRPPARHEAVARIEAGQAGEQRVDDPQVRLVTRVVAPGDLVALDRAGHDRGARQPAPVVPACRRISPRPPRCGRAASRSVPCLRPRSGRHPLRHPWRGRTRGRRGPADRPPRRRTTADRPGRSRPATSKPLPPARQAARRCGETGPPPPGQHRAGSWDGAVAGVAGVSTLVEDAGRSSGTLTSASGCTALSRCGPFPHTG